MCAYHWLFASRSRVILQTFVDSFSDRKKKLQMFGGLHSTSAFKCSLFVTRPAKIDHVGTFKSLKNTNLKYSMPHSSPVPDSGHVRFTLEVQQGNSY